MAKEKIDKRDVILYIAHCQLQLEVTDMVKNTPLYRHKIKLLSNQLEVQLEKIFKVQGIAQGFVEDEKSFFKLQEGISNITNWMANADFYDIMDLGKALKEGKIEFKSEEDGK
jgi:hypothetical protein